MRRLWLLAAFFLCMTLGVAPRQVIRSVTIADGKFSPEDLTISINETVRWINNDDRDHALVDEAGTFSSGKLKAGKAFDFKFARPGTYVCRCKLHPRERGQVTVK